MKGLKGKRLVVMVILVVLLAFGWFLSVRSASGIDDERTQAGLVESADAFAERELYIRAIPLYKQALGYATDAVPQIEKKLQQVYLKQGDTDSYVSLTQARALAQTAEEEEYLKAAEIYFSENDLENAMALLKKGMAQYPDGPVGELYEDHRYGYSMKVTTAKEILPTSGNKLMPAYDGTAWGYVNASGKFVLPAVYGAATPFNSGGYAVVSMDDTYYTIVDTGEKYGIDETHVSDVYGINEACVIAKYNDKYSYYTKDFNPAAPDMQFDEVTMNSCGVFAARNGDKWAVIQDDGEAATDYIYEDVAVNSLNQAFVNNAAMVKQDGLWYLVDPKGGKVFETGFADAKAPESSNYIAVANEQGKWGFIDRQGNLVIDYQYDDAFSFSNHLAAVKIVDTWGYISEQNEMVITESLESALPFHNYIAQAQFLENAALITLEYKQD